MSARDDSQSEPPVDEIQRAGRKALADELYDLRSALAGLGWADQSYTPEHLKRMRRRAAVLEPLVGDYLDSELATEDDRPDGVTPSRAPSPEADDRHET